MAALLLSLIQEPLRPEGIWLRPLGGVPLHAEDVDVDLGIPGDQIPALLALQNHILVGLQRSTRHKERVTTEHA